MASQLGKTFQSCYSKHRDPYPKPAPPYSGDCSIQTLKVSQFIHRIDQATDRRKSEQSGAFLDNCQPLPLENLDFPAGEQSAAALLKLSEGLIEKVGIDKQTDDIKKDGS